MELQACSQAACYVSPRWVGPAPSRGRSGMFTVGVMPTQAREGARAPATEVLHRPRLLTLSWTVGAVFNLLLFCHQDNSWKPQYPGPVVMGFCWVGNLSAFARPIVRKKMRGQRQGKLTIGSSSAESLSRIVNFFYCSWKISD